MGIFRNGLVCLVFSLKNTKNSQQDTVSIARVFVWGGTILSASSTSFGHESLENGRIKTGQNCSQNAGNAISETQEFKLFRGAYPRTPLDGALSYSAYPKPES